jgi:sigma-B regulation protein RsbU (phosphoserine phosphatase)
MLAKEPQTEKSNRVLSLMRGSTDRMFSLINDMLDFARLKSGAGMEVRLSSTDLRPVLEQVVNELRTAHPHRVIESEMALPDRVDCDPARIAQLVSNLLSNAITHGSKEGPVRLDACVQGEELIIKVANDGNRIPTEIQSRLFQPFFRAGTSGKGGLGLGLFIANEIATRHSGRMEVHSNDAETAFCLVMPATA